MSMKDVDQKLMSVVGKLDEAAKKIAAAALACAESRDMLGQAFYGATAPEAHEALDSRNTAVGQFGETRAKVNAVQERIERYRESIGGSTSTPQDRPTAPKRAPNAVGDDGSEYPPEAAWAVPELPRRVQQRGLHTVGKIKFGERSIPGQFRSDQGDIWVQEARKRINSLGISALPYVPYHVEIRAAAMMVHSGVTSAEVVINNVPCGYQNQPPGCHQVLEPFLPEGSQVTVSGTDRKGRPYRRTYHGKAKR